MKTFLLVCSAAVLLAGAMSALSENAKVFKLWSNGTTDNVLYNATEVLERLPELKAEFEAAARNAYQLEFLRVKDEYKQQALEQDSDEEQDTTDQPGDLSVPGMKELVKHDTPEESAHDDDIDFDDFQSQLNNPNPLFIQSDVHCHSPTLGNLTQRYDVVVTANVSQAETYNIIQAVTFLVNASKGKIDQCFSFATGGRVCGAVGQALPGAFNRTFALHANPKDVMDSAAVVMTIYRRQYEDMGSSNKSHLNMYLNASEGILHHFHELMAGSFIHCEDPVSEQLAFVQLETGYDVKNLPEFHQCNIREDEANIYSSGEGEDDEAETYGKAILDPYDDEN